MDSDDSLSYIRSSENMEKEERPQIFKSPKREPEGNEWRCSVCHVINDEGIPKCQFCKTQNSVNSLMLSRMLNKNFYTNIETILHPNILCTRSQARYPTHLLQCLLFVHVVMSAWSVYAWSLFVRSARFGHFVLVCLRLTLVVRVVCT